MLVWLLAAIIGATADVTLVVKAHGGASATADVTLRRIDAADAAPVTMTVTNTARVSLPQGTWSVDVDTPALWHKRQQFIAHENGTVVVEVWPRAYITGTMTNSSREVLVRFDSREVTCPVEQARFRCALPAGTLDLRIRPAGFIAQYRSGIVLEPGATRDLGAFEFREGQSITGRVEVPRGVALDSVTINARHEGSTSDARTAPVTDNGFFHIDGLAPGAYVVNANVARTLYSVPVQVVVRQGKEAELIEPLRLDRPRRIALDLAPAVSPKGARWRVRLSRYVDARSLDPVTESSATEEGAWQSPPLPPGRYQLVVETERDRWHAEDFTVTAADIHRTIALEQRLIRGTVMLGDRPLAATVTLRAGETSVQTASDDEGRFTTAMPHVNAKKLVAEIRSDVPRVQRRVTVDNAADIEIRLEPTSVIGEVVTARGKPAANAIVNIAGPGTETTLIQVRTAVDGSFAAHGVRPGRYHVIASGFLSESKGVDVVVDPAELVQPIKLVLDDQRVLRGRVVSAGNPVAGAQVHARAVDAPQMISAPRTTDPNGEFTVAVPPDARRFDVTVAPPGLSFTLAGVALSDRPFTISIDPRGGSLVVLAKDGEVPWLVHNGATAPATAVTFDWPAESAGGRTTMPMMEPGGYAACAVPPHLIDLFRGSAGQSGGRCVSGYLAPQGSLTLDLRSETQ